MDTISIKLNFFIEAVSSIRELETIKQKINCFRSNYGHRYVDVLEYNENGMIIKISYPRYYAGVNAYLIRKEAECQEVQQNFIQQLYDLDLLDYFSSMELLRVDIPFTYYMDDDVYFHYHENIFKIFACIYSKRFPKASPKAIQEILTGRQETLYYTDSKVIGNYNSRVMIYNQNLNIYDKLENDSIYQGILEEFPDLTKRIRIEVSKRIKRQHFSLKDFICMNIFSHYFYSFQEYLLGNLLNIEELEDIYEIESDKLAQILMEEKKCRGFSYEIFLLEYINQIWDYEVLRRAIKKSTPNINTRENAITKVRKYLRNWEAKNEVIVLDVYSIFYEIHNHIKNLTPEK